MRIESIHLKNFKAFKDVAVRDVPGLCILVGANGTGKSTLFSLFGFLKDALTDNVQVALHRLGGSRGFKEVRSRNSTGPIEIKIKFREIHPGPLITYSLSIDEENDRAFVAREILKYRRGSKGKPVTVMDYSRGEGVVLREWPDQAATGQEVTPERDKLASQDRLALKSFSQFEGFPPARLLGNLIEQWHLSDLHIQRIRPEQDAGYAEHLSREGENLSLVIDFLYRKHRKTFDAILDKLKQRVPGITQVDAKTTEEGRVLLRFEDGAFEDPFLARHVSDGTIKMLAYLVLLHDPSPHPLLCIEEPENQLYPSLLAELAEEFRAYAGRGGQVFVSTHSPDFLNAAELDEVFWLVKERGYTRVVRAQDNEQLCTYMREGDKMGFLWKQGFFDGADPGQVVPISRP